MILTKPQAEVMEAFVANVTRRFNVRQVSKSTGQHYSLTYRSIHALAKKGVVVMDEHKHFSLDYGKNHPVLAYVEAIRAEKFLKKNGTCALFVEDALNELKEDFFVLLVFGSVVKGKAKPGDVDVLAIVSREDAVEETERKLIGIAESLSAKFDVTVLPVGSAYELFPRREDPNVLNETLNNHVLLFGAENYYHLLTKARK